MPIAVVFGLLLVIAGAALAANVWGCGEFVIRNLTSRSLGSLAPGYAATPVGFKVYANLISAIGMVIGGFGLLTSSAAFAIVIVALGLLLFAVDSVIVIVGEVRTYRALERR